MMSSGISVVWICLWVCLLMSEVIGDIPDARESDSIVHDFGGKDAPRKMPPMPKKQMPMPDPRDMSEEELLKWDQTAFSKRDKNSNSFIEEDEIFQTMVEAAKAQENVRLSRSKTPPEQVEEKLAEVLKSKEEEMRKTARELLDKDDSNKDGRVSIEEFSEARKRHFDEMKKKNEL